MDYNLFVDNIAYLVAYPRSGTTWVRYLLACILYPNENLDHNDMNAVMPDTHAHRFWDPSRWKDFVVFKSHFANYSLDKSKMIYLYRDGRDVALSHYYYHYYQGTEVTFSQYFRDEFLLGRLRFGSWKEHVERWAFRKDKKLFVVSYEELFSNTFQVMKKVVEFLNLKLNPQIIEQAVLKADFRKMRKIGAAGGYHPKLLGLQGRSGGWKETFTDEDLDSFWSWAGDLMEKLGYKK